MMQLEIKPAKTPAMRAIEALHSMPDDVLLDMIATRLDSIDPVRLQKFADLLSRAAWEKQR